MGGKGKQIGGLASCLVGIIGVCVTCGLPMWRETSFVGANVVTAQWVWDGLWLHCVVQATGQMQCKSHTSVVTMTSDIQAGRVLILLSVLASLLGFIVTLLGGGVVNCSGTPPENTLPQSTSSSKSKVALLGGSLCILSGILCLVSVSWSAANTISVYNDPLVVQSLKREVGSSIYIGWASSLLLLLGGALICSVCTDKRSSAPAYRTYTPYRYISQISETPSRPATVRADVIRQYNPASGTRAGSLHGSFPYNLPSGSGTKDQGTGLLTGAQSDQGRFSRSTVVPSEYYYNKL